MGLNEKFAQLRVARLKTPGQSVPGTLQGVSKQRIRDVLAMLHYGQNEDMVDAVFALLDNQTDTLFANAPSGAKFSDGATTAQIASHVGILQRGNGKLDREGRDYWIKPLRQLGGIEPISLYAQQFIHGHVVPKSPNSAYRLADDFKAILQAPEDEWRDRLTAWAQEDAMRERQRFQADMAAASKAKVDSSHSDLIQAGINAYARNFLPGYEVIFVDDGDGDRIAEPYKTRLSEAGIELKLGDAMPDALLWNQSTDELWVLEAVTSDGEVDQHKVDQLTSLAKRSNKKGINFTTCYRTWREAAGRQGTHMNIAGDTYIWILADPSKHFLVKPYK
jgi:hypothetical protein